MVNVDDERTQKSAIPEGAGAAPRAGGKAARGSVGPSEHEKAREPTRQSTSALG